MKKSVFLVIMFVATFSYAQQDDVAVSGNTVTLREVPPVWPGCEDRDDKKSCWNENLIAHIKKNYRYPKDDNGEYIRGKATIFMEITENGIAVVTKVEGDNPKVNEAAKKMIMSMPKMTPGRLAGKPRAVKYTIPLTF